MAISKNNSLVGISKSNISKTTAYTTGGKGDSTRFRGNISDVTGDILNFPHNYDTIKT